MFFRLLRWWYGIHELPGWPLRPLCWIWFRTHDIGPDGGCVICGKKP